MKLHYRTDFSVSLSLRALGLEGEPAVALGYPDCDFDVAVTSGTPLRSSRRFVAWQRGGERHCLSADADGRVLVALDGHGLRPGPLWVEVTLHVPDTTMPDSVRTVRSVAPLGVTLTDNPADLAAPDAAVVVLPTVAVATTTATAEKQWWTVNPYICRRTLPLLDAVPGNRYRADSFIRFHGWAAELERLSLYLDKSCTSLPAKVHDPHAEWHQPQRTDQNINPWEFSGNALIRLADLPNLPKGYHYVTMGIGADGLLHAYAEPRPLKTLPRLTLDDIHCCIERDEIHGGIIRYKLRVYTYRCDNKNIQIQRWNFRRARCHQGGKRLRGRTWIWSDNADAPRCKKHHYFRVRRFQANGASEWLYLCVMTQNKAVVSIREARR